MIVLVVAPPSPYARPLAVAVRAIAGAQGSPVEYLHLSTLEKFSEQWQAKKSENLVMFCDAPDAALTRILSRASAPIVQLCDDPSACARHLVAAAKKSAADAVRMTCTSLAALHDLVCVANNLCAVTPQQFARPEALASDLAAFLDAPEGEAAALRALGAGAAAPSHDVPPDVADRQADVARYAPALAPFRALNQQRRVDALPLPDELFLTANPMGAPYGGGPIAMLGPARIVLFGPYLHLPAGTWRVSLRIDVAENLSGNVLKVEFMCGRDMLAQSMGRLPAEGAFDIDIVGAVAEPREPIELRVSLAEGAIEGLLTVSNIRAERIEG